MEILLPAATFLAVFAVAYAMSQRSRRTVAQIQRHQILGQAAAFTPRAGRITILGSAQRSSGLGRLVSKLTGSGARGRAEQLLIEAGSPMSVSTYLLMRVVFMLVLTPGLLVFFYSAFGLTLPGILIMFIAGITLPNLPSLRVKRKARARAKSIEHAMPDALDLLVVCAEGGLSLDGAIQQVSRRTDGTLAAEFQRLLSEVGSGMSRRDALIALGARSQSESLKIFCSTIIQADKMGMSIGTTLRTLSETMRTRRRQAAETQARKAPIKMLPFLVIFMIPSLFIVILGPVVVSMIGYFSQIE